MIKVFKNIIGNSIQIYRGSCFGICEREEGIAYPPDC